MAKYPFKKIEQKWQKLWEEQQIFRTPENPPKDQPKYYVLDMFPYPSGSGLHVGHPEGYTATDIIARYKRMKGFCVLHPMGWDAFGLPAEQYALETGTHPEATTRKNIDIFRKQLQSLGFSYDWSREIATTDADYYRWTQWIFLKLFEKGLAYQADVPVNWCPALGTVLANEEVIDGKSERGAHPVIRKPMRQWMLKITAYADRLLEDLNDLDWPESTKEMQRNWIGRSVGAEVDFQVQGNSDKVIRVFTTRPDTLFGATYMVLAPEHPYTEELLQAEYKTQALDYIRAASLKSDLERTELQKEKTGVFTGSFAINPVNDQPVPIWIADYVLGGYGTGAIMAVPGHDVRDYAFATQYQLPIQEVVSGGDISTEAYTGDGTLVNSASHHFSINDLSVPEAKKKTIEWLTHHGVGSHKVNYKLRDWLFSRQRYWGEPFPICFKDGKPHALPESELPLILPEVESYKPSGTGQSPLANITSWIEIQDPDTGKTAYRETNTMPQWAGSCWYYLRFIDPHNTEQLISPDKEKYWMSVDLYVGGAEHSVLHLLYARFWHKVLYDLGVVHTKEPFQKLVHQGMILGEQEFTLYRNPAGEPVSTAFAGSDGRDTRNGDSLTSEKIPDSEAVKSGDHFTWIQEPKVRIDAKAHKMSKSRGNVVNPDEVVEGYGADSLRLYEMFMGPLDQVKPWSMNGVAGVHRFLTRVWRCFMNEDTGAPHTQFTSGPPTIDAQRLLHKTIQKVTEDIENMRFNTAIASMMEFLNVAHRWEEKPQSILEIFLVLLNPFAPHITEELWQQLGKPQSIALESWPSFDPALLQEETQTLIVQVNGKVRSRLVVATDTAKETLLELAKQDPNITRFLADKTLVKEIYVPGKIINLVVR